MIAKNKEFELSNFRNKISAIMIFDEEINSKIPNRKIDF